jgi:putative ABC transport system substrate-binding protein
MTGVTALGMELAPKRLELAREMVPSATLIALRVNPANPNAEITTRDVQAAARALGLQLHVGRVRARRSAAVPRRKFRQPC